MPFRTRSRNVFIMNFVRVSGVTASPCVVHQVSNSSTSTSTLMGRIPCASRSCIFFSHWSCTRPLRIIPLVLKPGKMPSYHNDLRGHCHGVTPFLLPTRSVGAHMPLHHVASQLARAKRAPATPASPAHQAQAFH